MKNLLFHAPIFMGYPKSINPPFQTTPSPLSEGSSPACMDPTPGLPSGWTLC